MTKESSIIEVTIYLKCQLNELDFFFCKKKSLHAHSIGPSEGFPFCSFFNCQFHPNCKHYCICVTNEIAERLWNGDETEDVWRPYSALYCCSSTVVVSLVVPWSDAHCIPYYVKTVLIARESALDYATFYCHQSIGVFILDFDDIGY